MDLLNDDDMNLDLPTIPEVSRDVFFEETDKEQEFDVDKFLMKHNFQYMPLDSLIHDLADLSKKLDLALPEKVAGKYDDYLEFCSPYTDEDSESIMELQRTKTDLSRFISKLDQLTHMELARTRSTVDDTISYLRKLDEMTHQLRNHSKLPELIQLAKRMSTSLHSMCGVEMSDTVLIIKLTRQLHGLVEQISQIFSTLSNLNSPFLKHQRNEYHGLLQEFQISLKLLTAKCLEDPERNRSLAEVLVSILPNSR